MLLKSIKVWTNTYVLMLSRNFMQTKPTHLYLAHIYNYICFEFEYLVKFSCCLMWQVCLYLTSLIFNFFQGSVKRITRTRWVRCMERCWMGTEGMAVQGMGMIGETVDHQPKPSTSRPSLESSLSLTVTSNFPRATPYLTSSNGIRR